jgi:hypothetical protein
MTSMTQPDHTLDVPKAEVDTMNAQGVGAQGDQIVVIMPKARMSKTEALVHAATIVAMADRSENFEEFRSILKAVLEA